MVATTFRPEAGRIQNSPFASFELWPKVEYVEPVVYFFWVFIWDFGLEKAKCVLARKSERKKCPKQGFQQLVAAVIL